MHSYQNSPSAYRLRSGCSKDNLEIFVLISSDSYKALIIFNLLTYLPFLLIFNNTKYDIIMIIVFFATMTIPVLAWLSIVEIYKQSWVVEYKNRIIACALVREYVQYSELLRLYVHASHRNKGVGSCLVQTVIKEVRKPIYLISVPKALHFYTKLGFYRIPKHKIPRRISKRYLIGCSVLDFISTET